MSREKYFRHGTLREFLTNPKNWRVAHLFPVEAVRNIRNGANVYGVRVSAKYSGCIHTREVTLEPANR